MSLSPRALTLFDLISYRHLIGAALFAAVLPSCSQEAPQYPDQALLCESASDCPADWECHRVLMGARALMDVR